MNEQRDAWERLAQQARPAFRHAPPLPADLVDRVRNAAGRVAGQTAPTSEPWGACALVAALLAIAASVSYTLTCNPTASDPGRVVAVEALP